MPAPTKKIFVSAFFITALASGSAAAQSGSYIVGVPQPVVSFDLEFADAGVPLDATGIQFAALPRYGQLTSVSPSNHGWELVLHEDFWTVGSDALEITWTGPRPGRSRVRLVASRPIATEIYDFEENQQNPDPGTFAGNVSIGPEGAIFGARGLAIEFTGQNDTGFAEFTLPASQGSGNSSGGDVYVMINDPSDPPPIQGLLEPQPVTIMEIRSVQGEVIAEIEVIVGLSGAQMRMVAASRTEFGDWFPFPFDAAKRLRFDSNKEQAILMIDGRVINILRTANLAFEDIPRSYRIGSLAGFTTIPFRVRIDQVRLGNIHLADAWALRSQDTFDPRIGAGPMPLWTFTSEAAGEVSESMAGKLEISITNPSAWSSHRRDSSTDDDRRFHVGFDVDTSLLTMGIADEMLLLVGYPEEAIADNHIQIRLKPGGFDTFRIRADIWNDNGQMIPVGWTDTARGEHRVELVWQAAADDGIDDGYFHFFIDGTRAGSATDLDNDRRMLGSIRLGAFGIDDETSGTLAFDNYVTWTDSP